MRHLTSNSHFKFRLALSKEPGACVLLAIKIWFSSGSLCTGVWVRQGRGGILWGPRGHEGHEEVRQTMLKGTRLCCRSGSFIALYFVFVCDCPKRSINALPVHVGKNKKIWLYWLNFFHSTKRWGPGQLSSRAGWKYCSPSVGKRLLELLEAFLSDGFRITVRLSNTEGKREERERYNLYL